EHHVPGVVSRRLRTRAWPEQPVRGRGKPGHRESAGLVVPHTQRWFVRVDGRIALAEVEAERAFRLTRRLVILGRLVVFAAEQPRYNSVEHRPLVGGRVFRPRVVTAV